MKAILVIDEMPKTCEECKFSRWYGTACDIQNCDTYRDETGRDENCPLKPMPQKMEIDKEVHLNYRAMNKGYQCGWNACLDEILGDTE